MKQLKINEKPDVYIADRKRRRDTSETSQAHPYDSIIFKKPDEESARQAYKITKAVAHALKNHNEDDSVAGTDTEKSKR